MWIIKNRRARFYLIVQALLVRHKERQAISIKAYISLSTESLMHTHSESISVIISFIRSVKTPSHFRYAIFFGCNCAGWANHSMLRRTKPDYSYITCSLRVINDLLIADAKVWFIFDWFSKLMFNVFIYNFYGVVTTFYNIL